MHNNKGFCTVNVFFHIKKYRKEAVSQKFNKVRPKFLVSKEFEGFFIVTSVTSGLAIKISMIDFRSFTVSIFITDMLDLYLNERSLQMFFNLLDTLAH